MPLNYILHLYGSRVIRVAERGKINTTVRVLSSKPGAGFFTEELQHVSTDDILSATERYKILVFQHAEKFPEDIHALHKKIKKRIKKIDRTMKGREVKQRIFPWKNNRNHAKR